MSNNVLVDKCVLNYEGIAGLARTKAMKMHIKI